MRYSFGQACLLVEIILAGFLLFGINGYVWGRLLAESRNIQRNGRVGDYRPALPTRIYDRHGRIITEFFSEEKREIVPFERIPRHLVEALLTREDKKYYEHHGFRLYYILRAAWDIITGRSFRGGSTITQQLAGHLFADRSEITLTRKLKELWWALHLEAALSKNEILELYLNEMYFGHNTYGVQAASQFYFQRPVEEISLAESVMLVIQLASPARYSPFNNPNQAKDMQWQIMEQMVGRGFVSKEEAEYYFAEYWEDHDHTRSHIASAWFDRRDKAPYFSEYVRQSLEDLLLGSMDLYREGLQVHTTLDLDLQLVAERTMSRDIEAVNEQVRNQDRHRLFEANRSVIPLVDLLSLTFNIDDIRAGDHQRRAGAVSHYLDHLNPAVDMIALAFGIEGLKNSAREGYETQQRGVERRRVEGALVAIDSETGEILAMVGGRKFEPRNQFNRAVQSRVQPGSAFKPLYYSAALSQEVVTPATVLMDSPTVFRNDDGTPYIPLNYKGQWNGRVTLRDALSQSMNVPSLQVLQAVGFDAAIIQSSLLLGLRDPWESERIFPRKYPLGLGVATVSPLQMARAYAVFANQGRSVEPAAIRYITDRDGDEVYRASVDHANQPQSVLSPQEAYIMVNLLESAVSSGTLRWAVQSAGWKDRPVAGKTGTTQNWADAWTIGFTPQITTAVWFGFDRPGGTLGVSLTGAVLAGPAWAEFMKEAHQNLPIREFLRPLSGLTEQKVCRQSGLLPTAKCGSDIITEIFLSGTEPREFCSFHSFLEEQREVVKQNLRRTFFGVEVEIADDETPDWSQIWESDILFVEESESTPRDRNPLLE